MKNKNIGINEYSNSLISFLKRVFNYMAGGLALSGLTAYVVANTALIVPAIKLNLIIFFIWFGYGIFINRIILKKSASAGLLAFVVFSILTGFMLAPIILVYTTASIATAFFVTSGIFIGTSFLGLSTNKSLEGWGYFLRMTFIGLAIAVILNIILFALGVNVQLFSIALSFLIVPAVAVGVVYETNQLKEIHAQIYDEEFKHKFAILGATSLYTSFVVMFVNILNIFNLFNR